MPVNAGGTWYFSQRYNAIHGSYWETGHRSPSQALTPTPVLATLRATALTHNHTSLVVAKPDRVEVWDVTETGLVSVAELKVWGTIVSIDQVSVEGSRPHIVILLSPPNARALMVAFDKATSVLV
ncbi:hypothetical protein B9479_008200, partial [Cryptococcus floricola]